MGGAGLSKVALLHPAVVVYGRYLGVNISGFVSLHPRWAEAQRLVVGYLLLSLANLNKSRCETLLWALIVRLGPGFVV